jgi:hypothetical protein
VHSNGRSWVSASIEMSKMAYSDNLTKWYMRGLYCMRANRSSSRQPQCRVVRLQWDCVEMSWVWSEVVAGGRSLVSQPSRARKRAIFVRQCQVRAPSTRPLPPLDPHTAALLRYSTPCTILLLLLCHKYCIYSLTDHRHKQHHLSAPAAAPTLPHSDVPSTATCRDTPRHRTAHPGTSASLPVSRVTPGFRRKDRAIDIALYAVSH